MKVTSVLHQTLLLNSNHYKNEQPKQFYQSLSTTEDLTV